MIPSWTDAEEVAFAEIQSVSRLTRIKAIHLWKRCRKNIKRAVKLAKEQYPPLSQPMLDKFSSMRAIKKAIAKTERPITDAKDGDVAA